jgi:hypothetical protein
MLAFADGWIVWGMLVKEWMKSAGQRWVERADESISLVS